MTEQEERRARLRKIPYAKWRDEVEPHLRRKVKALHSGGDVILAAMLEWYIDMENGLLSGLWDDWPEAAMAYKDLDEHYNFLKPILGQDSSLRREHLETISGWMHDCGYSAEERADEREKLETERDGRPPAEEVLYRMAQAFELYLKLNNWNLVADQLCLDREKHKPHKADTEVATENPCACRFRKEATRLKNFLDAHGYGYES